MSGKDGDIILMEYIEEFPSFMSFVGMSSKLKNYYKKKLENDKGNWNNYFRKSIMAKIIHIMLPFIIIVHFFLLLQNNLSELTTR